MTGNKVVTEAHVKALQAVLDGAHIEGRAAIDLDADESITVYDSHEGAICGVFWERVSLPGALRPLGNWQAWIGKMDPGTFEDPPCWDMVEIGDPLATYGAAIKVLIGAYFEPMIEGALESAFDPYGPAEPDPAEDPAF